MAGETDGKVSRKKPTKKAATRSRSTTSSTTARKAKRPTKKAAAKRTAAKEAASRAARKVPAESPTTPLAVSQSPRNAKPQAEPLSADQQEAVLALLLRGASPAGACQQLGLGVEAVGRTVEEDEAFRRRAGDVTGVLSGNVMAVLYRGAMEGSVSAQQAWLKLFPPPPWQRGPQDGEAETRTPATFDETLKDLTDAELVELARAMGVDLPGEPEAGLDAAAEGTALPA
jgi:hypothetical protein